jgi:thioredoxin-dependent peroxiredoxin
MSRKLLLALLCAALVMGTARLCAAAHLLAGTPAPRFTLKSQDGTPVSLQDFRGQWVVLYFYPKDFSSGCTVEAHNFERDLEQYKKLNAVILGVSVDSPDSHHQFCVKEGLSFKLLADTDHSVSEEYGTLTQTGFTHAARNTFLIAPDGRIARVFDDVNPAEHSTQVLAALTELEKK